VGTFKVGCVFRNPGRRGRTVHVPKLLVDTGSEHTWVSEGSLKRIGIRPEKKDVAFIMANGKTITRRVGFAIVQIGEHFTIDEVVFGQTGDLQILGARSLEGLNLTVDARRKRLVASGPLPAAPGNL
jgi:predicted aspartyl protease